MTTVEFDIEAFRSHAREFIADHAPRHDCLDGVRVPVDAAEEKALRHWYAELFDEGMLGGGWPARWGGRADHSPMQDLVVMEELIRARAPRPIDQVLLASHALISFGTDVQRDTYLPRIRSGVDIWCQLFSEPGVGSDLAALSTRATRVDGGWRVDGQKVWTTDAQWAQMGLLLARTDPEQRPQAGITAFLVPMDTPGVTVRPIREMTGSAEFCEVFFDDAVLPEDAVLGAVDGGWTVATSGLASERAYVGANAVQLEMMHQDLVELARAVHLPDGGRAMDRDDVKLAVTRFWTSVVAVQLLVRDTASRAIENRDSASDGPAAKLAYTELNVAMCRYAMDLAGFGEIDDADHAVVDRWEHAMLWSRALTISGGSSEIISGLLARQLLGLPRSWGHRR